ncbi:MAG: ABC transporter ATP-binding protein [Burkholderiales bacterium]|nr:ABC transporter ATP-binding protein [Burkholderiales bacterium]
MTAPASPALLVLDSVAQRYGEIEVLHAVSFAIRRGTIACLLGTSGCGKTTVLRCIAGFEPLSRGEIRLDGEVVSRPGFLLAPERRRIGMVFQDYALFPHRTVAANVGFGLNALARHERAERVAELLEVVGLAAAAHKYPHELSGGQQQRVALARALAPRPRLLLLDEPFSNLDVELRERLSTDVRAILKQQNATALLVTHDQHEAFSFADEIGIMHAGSIQQWDSAYELYHRPGSRLVADFIGQGVLLPGVVRDAHHIACELGVLASPQAHGFANGEAVEVLIRPDDVLHDDASTARAEVLHKAFRGAQFLYTLRLAGGSRVLSLVPSHHNHAIGERIGIRVEIDHLVAFAKPDDALQPRMASAIEPASVDSRPRANER